MQLVIFFYLYSMFHASAARFDVIGNLVKFWVFGKDLRLIHPGGLPQSHIATGNSDDPVHLSLHDTCHPCMYKFLERPLSFATCAVPMHLHRTKY